MRKYNQINKRHYGNYLCKIEFQQIGSTAEGITNVCFLLTGTWKVFCFNFSKEST